MSCQMRVKTYNDVKMAFDGQKFYTTLPPPYDLYSSILSQLSDRVRDLCGGNGNGARRR